MKQRITINMEVPAFDKKAIDWPIPSNTIKVCELSVIPGGASPNTDWIKFYRSACYLPNDCLYAFQFDKEYIVKEGRADLPYHDEDGEQKLHLEIHNGHEQPRPFSIVMVVESIPEIQVS